ncbi:MAG: carbohydrate porin [Nitrospirota bacterium]|nr:carbohydrate porin [Nitrospirota bacterium]
MEGSISKRATARQIMWKHRLAQALVATGIVCLAIGTAHAQSADGGTIDPGATRAHIYSHGLMDRDTLTGDWGGARSSMTDKGITFEAVYTGEYFVETSGGVAHGDGYLDNRDISLELDAETLWGWHGATWFFYALGNDGNSPSRFVGDAQATSNIETGVYTWKLYEAWLEQKFGEGTSAKLGLIDLNSEFDVTETAGLFLSSSHGIGPDFSQSGLGGPSIFPTTSLALRLETHFGENAYLRAGMFDGVSGDLNNPKGTQVELHPGKEGWLVTVEAGLQQGLDEDDTRPFHKYALGYWTYTEDVPATDTVTGNPETGSGFYAIADRALGDNLSAFLRLGMASDKAYGIGSYVGTGAVLTGVFGEDDQLGLGIAHAIIGDTLAQSVPAPGLENAETSIELTYCTQIAPWLTVQPDVQHVFAPAADPTLDDATIVSLRFEAAF